MKKNYSFLKPFLLTILAAIFYSTVYAVNYTAVASGNFSSKLTWMNGNVPPASLKAGDKVSIANGINVTLDQNVLLTLAANLEVDGTLMGGAGYVLQVNNGTLTGSGDIDIDSMSCGTLSGLAFTGNYSVNSFYTTNAMMAAGAKITVNKTLYLSGGAMTIASGTLNLSNGATIVVSTGSLKVTGGSADLTSNYNLIYKGVSVLAGMELNGAGLQAVEVDMTGANEVSLSADVMLMGMLTLTSGYMNLNGHTLTFATGADLSASGTGAFKGSGSSDIEVTTATGLTGALRFSLTGDNVLGDLTINCSGSSAVVKLGTELRINGQLELLKGHLHLQAHKLILLTGASVNGGSKDSYAITSGGGRLGIDVNGGTTQMFHVGTENNYAPCKMTSSAGSINTRLDVGVQADVLSDGTTGYSVDATQPLVDATWFVDNTNSGNLDFEMELYWDASMEVNSFNRAKAYISHYTAAGWDADAAVAATMDANGMYKLSRKGIKTFSPFAVFDENTAASVNQIETGAQAMTLYPNPAQNTLYVNYRGYRYQQATLQIYNTVGQRVASMQVKNTLTSVDLTDMKAGLYFLYLEIDNAVYTLQFVKQ